MAGGASLATRGRYTAREAPPPLIKLPPRPKLHARTQRVHPPAQLQGPRRVEARTGAPRGGARAGSAHARAGDVRGGRALMRARGRQCAKPRCGAWARTRASWREEEEEYGGGGGGRRSASRVLCPAWSLPR
ncbi:hypothetical protein AcV5_003681 [Taiwanofungus camphoratus]|nr:hypothetical protein AcV5_003681 [Antrodia cinnamomea]